MKKEKRTYWKVTTVDKSSGTTDSGRYRSRHDNATVVKNEFVRRGHTVKSVKAWS